VAAPNAVKNAAEAAGKAAGKGRRVDAPNPQSVTDLSEKSRQLLRDSATERRLSVNQAFELDYKLLPQLEQAGYSNDVIKSLLANDDQYTAVKQFMVDETQSMTDAIKASPSGAGIDLARTSFADLKSTYDSLATQGERPSNIRGKVDDAGDTVESRDGGDVPRTSAPEMETEAVARADEAGAAAAKEAPKDREGRGFYSDGIRRGGPGFFQEEARPPVGNFESMISPGGGIQKPTMVDIAPADPATPSMQELINLIDRQGTNPSKPKAADRTAAARATSREQLASDASKLQTQIADPGAPQQVTGDAFYAGSNIPTGSQRVGIVEQRGGGSAAPPPPPPPSGPPGGPPDDPPPPEVPKAVKNSRILAAARGVGRNVRDNWFDYALGGAVVGVPTAYGLGYFGGKGRPQQGNAQQSPAGGGPTIQILPRSELRSREQIVPQAPPMMQPPPQQPPQRPAPAQPGQTTDIIRQLSGRMA
jgi:hypothetical protein